MSDWNMQEEAIEHLIFEGVIAVVPSVEEKINELIRLWSDKDPKMEWGCCLYGSYTANRGEAIPLVTGFVELPAWNLNRGNSLSINLDDIVRIAEEYDVIALLHSHPTGQLFPSAQDLATFLYTDLLLDRPLLYIIASPDGKKLILTFEKCHACKYSFLKAMAVASAIKKSAGRAAPPAFSPEEVM